MLVGHEQGATLPAELHGPRRNPEREPAHPVTVELVDSDFERPPRLQRTDRRHRHGTSAAIGAQAHQAIRSLQRFFADQLTVRAVPDLQFRLPMVRRTFQRASIGQHDQPSAVGRIGQGHRRAGRQSDRSRIGGDLSAFDRIKLHTSSQTDCKLLAVGPELRHAFDGLVERVAMFVRFGWLRTTGKLANQLFVFPIPNFDAPRGVGDQQPATVRAEFQSLAMLSYRGSLLPIAGAPNPDVIVQLVIVRQVERTGSLGPGSPVRKPQPDALFEIRHIDRGSRDPGAIGTEIHRGQIARRNRSGQQAALQLAIANIPFDVAQPLRALDQMPGQTEPGRALRIGLESLQILRCGENQTFVQAPFQLVVGGFELLLLGGQDLVGVCDLRFVQISSRGILLRLGRVSFGQVCRRFGLGFLFAIDGGQPTARG